MGYKILKMETAICDSEATGSYWNATSNNRNNNDVEIWVFLRSYQLGSGYRRVDTSSYHQQVQLANKCLLPVGWLTIIGGLLKWVFVVLYFREKSSPVIRFVLRWHHRCGTVIKLLTQIIFKTFYRKQTIRKFTSLLKLTWGPRQSRAKRHPGLRNPSKTAISYVHENICQFIAILKNLFRNYRHNVIIKILPNIDILAERCLFFNSSVQLNVNPWSRDRKSNMAGLRTWLSVSRE